MIWQTFGTLDFDVLFGSPDQISMVFSTQPEIFHWICILLLVGAIGKIGSVSVAGLVARRDGRPDACFGIDSRCDDGHGGRVFGGP